MYGVARVLATETETRAGERVPRKIIWLVYDGYLIRAAPEQLQRASAREQQLEELKKPQRLPWTFARLLQGLRPGTYTDISGEHVPSEENLRSAPRQEPPDEEFTWPSRRPLKRLRQKSTVVPTMIAIGDEAAAPPPAPAEQPSASSGSQETEPMII